MIDASKLLAMDKTVILYRPQYNEFTGSPLATILLGQIAYWWDKSGAKPFFKFKEPCDHNLYREGDSWCEELGFSRRLFDSALKSLEAEGLVTHKVDRNRLTWYTLNVTLLTEKMVKLYSPSLNENDSVKCESAFTVKCDNAFSVKCNSAFTYTETTQETTQKTNLSPENQSKDSNGKNNSLEHQEEEMKVQTNNLAILEKIGNNMPTKKHSKNGVNPLSLKWKSLRAEFLDGYQAELTGKDLGFLKTLLKDFGGVSTALLEYAVLNWAQFAEKACQSAGVENRPTLPQLGFISQHRAILGKLYQDSLKAPKLTQVTTPETVVAIPDDTDALFDALA